MNTLRRKVKDKATQEMVRIAISFGIGEKNLQGLLKRKGISLDLFDIRSILREEKGKR